MRRAVLQDLMTRKPFKPFRIVVSTDRTFDVRHPEAAYLAKRFMALARPIDGEVYTDAIEMVWIDYRHIVLCQPISSRESPF